VHVRNSGQNSHDQTYAGFWLCEGMQAHATGHYLTDITNLELCHTRCRFSGDWRARIQTQMLSMSAVWILYGSGMSAV